LMEEEGRPLGGRLCRHSSRRCSAFPPPRCPPSSPSSLPPSCPPSPLVVLTQPPPLFIIRPEAPDPSVPPFLPPSLPPYFTVRVGLPRCCHRAVKRLQTSCPLVVELRYEGGGEGGGEGGVEQSLLNLREEPLLRPGEKEWVVHARIESPSRDHGRNFVLFVDVGAFEQGEHGLCISGVETAPIRTLLRGGRGRGKGKKGGREGGRERAPQKNGREA
jgi:hypothetical protein